MKITFAVLLLFIFAAPLVFAQNTSRILPFRSNERVVLDENETIERDFFATGERVEIRGTVNGDLYAAGGKVVVDGTVNGDVLTAGGSIELNGQVAGDVRAAGGSIELNGVIGRNFTAGAGNIKIDEEASVSGSMVFGAGNVEVDGTVGGNVIGGVGNLVVSNAVGGNIYTGVGELEVAEGVNIGGDVIYWSDGDAKIDQNASVAGTLERRETPEPVRERDADAFAGFRVFSLLSMLAIGLLVVRFFPGVLEAGAEVIETRPWASLGFGLMKLILVPLIAVMLFITVIGFPLGIFLIFLYSMELYFATYFAVYWIGRFLMSRFGQKADRYWTFVVGTLVFAFITIVPIVGGIVRFLSLLFGLGAILILKLDWYRRAFRQQK